MLPFLAAIIAVIGISFGASFVLEGFQRTVDAKYHTEGVRLDPEMGQPPHSATEHAGAQKGVAEKH